MVDEGRMNRERERERERGKGESEEGERRGWMERGNRGSAGMNFSWTVL